MSSSARSPSCSPIDSFAARFKLRGELQEAVERVVRARGHGVVVRAIHRDGVRRGASAAGDGPAAPVAARGGELRDEGAVDAAEEGRAPVLAGSEVCQERKFIFFSGLGRLCSPPCQACLPELTCPLTKMTNP